MKQRVLIYGNCQGEWIHHQLARDPAFADRYELIYHANFGVTPPDHIVLTPGFFNTCDLVLWQTSAQSKPPAFLSVLGPNCKQIRYPTLCLKILWPFHCGDPRNAPEPGFHSGPFPYGDRLVLKLREAGVSDQDLVARYLSYDVKKLVNLDRFADIAITELRFNDRNSDIQVGEYIVRHFRDRKLFATVNHPAMGMLERLAASVRQLLDGGTCSQEIPESEDARDPFGEIEIPIHPAVIEHFGVTWTRPGMRYRYNSKFLTLEEWIDAYLRFERIPICTPPGLSLAIAQQAHRFGDIQEAKRLLLGGAKRFPQHAEFLRYLGLMLAQQGQLTEAEQVLRYALSVHPSIPVLHFDVARLMVKGGFYEEGLRLTTVGLALAPGDVEGHKLRNFFSGELRKAAFLSQGSLRKAS